MSADLTLDQRGVNTVRGLAMDAVQHADSGHTGTAMALAPVAHVLFTRVMTYDATDPQWADRDRFVLSCGHASMLLYSYLHLCGFGLTLDDLRQFRQLGSATPGHPEAGHTAGVEVTTGPLGQGIANAVGLAMAERRLRARLGADAVDHHTFVLCSDGDLMEGVSHEAASLAGHQGLGRLVVVYDDNRITIDGSTDLALSDDAAGRFRAYGWHVAELGEMADDLDGLEAALRDAMAVDDRPSLLVLRTHIGQGLPTQHDTPEAHGAITDADEIAGAKRGLGLDPGAFFAVPDDVAEMYRTAGVRGSGARAEWEARVAAREDAHAVRTLLDVDATDGWRAALPTWEPGEGVATRKAIQACLQALAPHVPALVAGGADLTGNTGTQLGEAPMSAAEPGGRQIYFGVREHAMGSAAVGMALHGGVLPAVGTFLVFSDYMRPAVRLAALSGAAAWFVWTHDSVGVGEDGPTHQPVEHVAALRAIPGLAVYRPADATEVAGAVADALTRGGPAAFVLSRQSLPVLAATTVDAVADGAYVLSTDDDPEVVLVGTGSEVQLCVTAAETLRGAGRRVRVVSMPSQERFVARPLDDQHAVLPPAVPTVAVEAGVSAGWHRWAQATVSLDRFGVSAPGSVAMAHLGFTAEAVAEAARGLLD